MSSDAERHSLYVVLSERLGPQPADTLMSMLPPQGWSDVVRQPDLVPIRSDLDAVRADIGVLRGEIGGVRAELTADIAGLRAHVDLQFARIVYVNVVSMFAVAGLVLAAVSLAR